MFCPLPIITLLIRGAEQACFSLSSVIETSPGKRRNVLPEESTNEGVRRLSPCPVMHCGKVAYARCCPAKHVSHHPLRLHARSDAPCLNMN